MIRPVRDKGDAAKQDEIENRIVEPLREDVNNVRMEGNAMNSTTNHPATVSEGSTGGHSDALAAFFLDRLRRLLALRPIDAELSEDEATRLVRHAIYATYRDLQGLGRGREARGLLATSRHRRVREREG